MKIYTRSDFPPPKQLAAKPYRVFGACLDRTLGDFMARAYYLIALKHNRESRTEITAYWHNDRSYKAPIMRLAPQIDHHIVGTGAEILPLDAFYDAGDRRQLLESRLGTQVTRAHARSDLVLLPSMMLIDNVWQFAKLPTFQIPRNEAANLMQQLRKLGLDFGRWHATITYRLPNYEHRGATTYRDIHHEDRFEALARHIIAELDGQVVRIGHSGMAPWNLGPSFIDLSRSKDFLLHAYAVAMSRFCLVTPFGPALLPAAFNIPFAISNAVSTLVAFRKDTLVLPRPLYSREKIAVNIDELFTAGGWTDDYVRHLTHTGFTAGDNSAAELCALANRLFTQTAA